MKILSFSTVVSVFVFSILLIETPTVSAQGLYGLQNSNFSGIHNAYTNPAHLTTLAYRRHSNLSTFALSVDNNYYSIETPFPLFKLATGNVPDQYKNDKGKVAWNPSYLNANSEVNSAWGNINMEWRGPSYAKRLGRRVVFGYGVRTRANMAIKDVNPAMAQWVNSLSDSANIKNVLGGTNYPLNFQANAYQEISGSLSVNIINVGGFRMAVGGTAKYLMGLGHMSMINTGTDIQTFGKDSIRINQSNIQIAYSDPKFMDRFTSGLLSGSLPSLASILGGGFGFDLGILLEGGNKNKVDGIIEKWIIPDVNIRDYAWKIAASVTDIGTMNYGQEISRFTASNTTPVTLPLDTALAKAFLAGNSAGLKYLENFAEKNMDYKKESGTLPFALPTMLQIQADFRMLPTLYLGVHWQQSLVSAKTLGFRNPSSLVVIPRFEMAWLECSLPVSLTQDYKRGAIGGYLRVGPVFIGSDNLVTTVLTNKARGFNLYFGVSGGIKNPKRTARG